MRSICLIILGVLLSGAMADNILKMAGHLSLNKRTAMGPLLQKAELIHRVRRQTSQLLGPRDSEQCVLDCMETMDEKLTEAFPEVSENSTDGNVAQVVLEGDYDPEKFEKFCDIYTPSSRCLRQCANSDLKKFTQKSLGMVEYMCVDRYDDFRKYGKCMDKAGKEIDEICTKQCKTYEKGMKMLENVTSDDSTMEYDEIDIYGLLNESCLYVACLMECDQPIMVQNCGQAAADLESDTIQIAFESLDDLLAEASGDEDMWPESCSNLAKKDGEKKPTGSKIESGNRNMTNDSDDDDDFGFIG